MLWRSGLLAVALLAVLAAAAPARAAIHYKAVTATNGGSSDQRTEVEGWIDGAKGKIAFGRTAAPGLAAGQYLLTKDGGKTLLLVDPEEKTYATWDLEAMLASLGGMLQAIGPLVNFKIENVAIEKLGEEPGGSLHGLATRHSTFRTVYDMTIKVMGMGRQNHVSTTEDLWTTDELTDAALGVWLRNAPHTGFGELDKLLEAEMGKVSGFPLKTVSVSTTTGAKGKRSTETRTTTEITELDRGAVVSAATFEVPAGYTESQAMLPGADG